MKSRCSDRPSRARGRSKSNPLHFRAESIRAPSGPAFGLTDTERCRQPQWRYTDTYATPHKADHEVRRCRRCQRCTSPHRKRFRFAEADEEHGRCGPSRRTGPPCRNFCQDFWPPIPDTVSVTRPVTLFALAIRLRVITPPASRAGSIS